MCPTLSITPSRCLTRLRLKVSWLVRRSRGAKTLQRWIRRSHGQRLRAKARKARRAAIKIQSAYRGMVSRRQTAWLKHYIKVAIVIQRVYRYVACCRRAPPPCVTL